MLKNYMEIVIDQALPAILKKYNNICTCDRCIEDIKAIALNKFMPLYVVTEKGVVYSKINQLNIQFDTDVISEITKAVEIVSKNPRHNK